MTLEIIGMEIKDTTLTGRTKNALRYAGIDYVSVLKNITANELLRIPNLGRKSIEEIIEFLGQYGYELQGQDKFYKQKKKLPWVVKLIEEAIAQEREACAKICEDRAKDFHALFRKYKHEEDAGANMGATQCMDLIRARGEA
jgi:hypothetical protein